MSRGPVLPTRSSAVSRELRRGATAGVVIFAAALLARTVSELLFARVMGRAQFGAYSYVFAWLSILAVAAGFGVPYAYVRFIPEYEVRADRAALGRLLRFGHRSAVRFGAAIAVAAGGIVLLTRPTGVSAAAVVVGMLCVPFISVLTERSEAARGFRHITLAYLPSLVLRPLLTVVGALALLLAAGHVDATEALGAGLLATVLCVLAQRPRLRRLLAASAAANVDHPAADRDASAERGGWRRVALPLLAINALAAIAMRADVIVVGVFDGASEAGVYAVAARVALLASFALEALNTIAAPTIARLFYAGDLDGVQRLVRNVARATLGAALLVSFALLLAGSRSLTVFGSGFSGGMPALEILLVGQLVNASSGPVGNLLITTGHQGSAALAQLVATVAFLISAVPLTLAWGFLGTAVAVTVGRAVVNIWMMWTAQRRLGIRSFVI